MYAIVVISPNASGVAGARCASYLGRKTLRIVRVRVCADIGTDTSGRSRPALTTALAPFLCGARGGTRCRGRGGGGKRAGRLCRCRCR